jgi:xanthine dehydrogenase accessory factor
VVIVTRGHKEDGQVLEALAARAVRGERPKFLGMIGSKTKRAVLFRHLTAAGVDPAFLDRIRSPVGLSLGARSHEEIAVAVVAELIQVRRTGVDAAATWGTRKLAGRQDAAVSTTVPEP